MEEKWGWPGALGAAILATIFASLAIAAGGGWGWVIEAVKWLDFTSGSTSASWAQAVFSFAAVVVALRIAGRSDRRKEKEDEDRAAVVAARLASIVDSVESKLLRTCFSLQLATPSFTRRSVSDATEAMSEMHKELY